MGDKVPQCNCKIKALMQASQISSLSWVGVVSLPCAGPQFPHANEGDDTALLSQRGCEVQLINICEEL